MIRKQGSGFKMKRSPVKQGLLSDFFSNIGGKLKKGQKERGIFSETAKAEKRERRKTGESKFQYDVRKKKEAKKAEVKTSTQGKFGPVSVIDDNPIQKKSPYKKGIGSYAKKAKGSRGYKMKKK